MTQQMRCLPRGLPLLQLAKTFEAWVMYRSFPCEQAELRHSAKVFA